MAISRNVRPAFTLVELLVVIGIIALLISILLPSLSAARRQANTVKCSSALRQIFNGFKMYEIDNRGYWPVAMINMTPAMSGYPSGSAYNQLHWTDFVSKYVHKDSSRYAGDLTQVRQKSVIWGCPEFQKVDVYYAAGSGATASTIYADSVRNGYGMTHYTMGKGHVGFSTAAPYSVTNPRPGNGVYLDYAAPSYGTWQKGTTWQRKGLTLPGGFNEQGSAARGLIADSNLVWTDSLSGYSKSKGGFLIGGGTTPVPNTTNGYINVDASRHAKKSLTVDQFRTARGINMLYCDGHVDTVEVLEAWKAMRNSGLDTALP